MNEDLSEMSEGYALAIAMDAIAERIARAQEKSGIVLDAHHPWRKARNLLQVRYTEVTSGATEDE